MGHPVIGDQLDVYDALGEVAPTTPEVDALDAMIAAWLASYASEHTRKAYARDLRAWLAFCARVADVHPLQARRVHVDAWARSGAGFTKAPSPASLARRLSAVSAWYAYLVTEEVAERNPLAHVRRPAVDADESDTRGLTRDEAKVMLIVAREALTQRDRAWIMMGLLLGLRSSAARSVRVEDLGWDRGHRTLTYVAKGGKRRTVPVPPMLGEAIDVLAAGRTEGPLLATTTGRPVSASTLFRATQRCAELAGLHDPETVTPHSLRHTFITLALDNGATLRDVQDAAGHADPRTTRRYDRARGALDRHPAYSMGAYLS